MSASNPISSPPLFTPHWRRLLTAGLCALALFLALCPAVFFVRPASAASPESRGGLRGAVSLPAPAAAPASSGPMAPAPSGPDDVEDKRLEVSVGSGDIFGGDASANPDAAARRNTIIMNGGSFGWLVGGSTDKGAAEGNKAIMNGGLVDQIAGGKSTTGAVRGNSVKINNGIVGTPPTGTVYGGYSEGELAENNTVTLNGGRVWQHIYGGMLDNSSLNPGLVTGNKVIITGGITGPYTYGGMLNDGEAHGNSVSLSGTGTAQVLVGGNAKGLAQGNFVEIKGGRANKAIGGNSFTLANGNYVTMGGGIVEYGISGGEGDVATGNGVTLSGGSVGIYGGASSRLAGGAGIKKAQGNSVTVTGGDVSVAIVGGYSTDGDALENVVSIDGAATKVAQVTGGQSNAASASGNIVYMKNGEVLRGPVIGGSGALAATGNKVEMSGGTVTGEVVGGFAAAQGLASGNSVLIIGGTVGGAAGSYVAGGVTAGGSATKNIVTLSGAPANMSDLSGTRVYGGYDQSGTAVDVFTGNILNVLGFQGKARTVANFSEYKFLLPAHIANGSVVMQLSEATDISAPPSQSLRASIIGMVKGGARLHGGDVIHLLKSDISLKATGMHLTGGRFAQGLTRNYDYELRLTTDSLDAIIQRVELSLDVDAPTDGPSADGGLINGGTDLMAGQGMDHALAAARAALRPERSQEQANPWGVGVFGAFTGGQTDFNTPSRLSLASTHYAVGLTKLFDLGGGELIAGIFLDAGIGGYTSQRKAAEQSAGADGHNKYYGGGVLSRYTQKRGPLVGAYVEGTARTGLVESSYSSSDLQARVGSEVKYDRRVPYYSAHGGIGYIYPFSAQASVDVYGKFFASRVEGSTQDIAGDAFAFSPLDSYRLRGGARASYAFGDSLSLYLGAAYEHEFDSTPRTNVVEMDIKGDSMRGGTGIGEGGLSFTLGESKNFSMDIGVQGFIGQREGVMGTVRAQFEF